MKCDVYLNLRKKTFSVRSREKENYGKVVSHRRILIVRNPTFVVNEAGRAKVLQKKQKNVHAFVRGEIVDSKDFYAHMATLPLEASRSVTYNPYKNENFIDCATGEAVYNGNTVLMFIDELGAAVMLF